MKCVDCEQEKDISEFYLLSNGEAKTNFCKKCYNLRYKNYRTKYVKDNVEKVKKWKRKDYEQNIITYMLSGAKRRAEEFGLEFNITREDIVIPDFCPILGIPIIAQAGKGRTGNAPSIDRIDNNKGYTKDNILIVSDRANSLKSDGTEEERKKLFDFYKKLMFNQIFEMPVKENL